MSILSDIVQFVLAKRRQRTVEKRESVERLAAELDKLADLMSEVLEVTSPAGEIRREMLPDLDEKRRQVWNRWVTILGTHGYATKDRELQEEIEDCVKIAHAAPGAFVEEVLLCQLCLSKGHVNQEQRLRFAKSISRLKDLTTRMRLDS
ncbi:MAG: hypothetical protein OXQ86_00260 [Gammaproteobacteria bacterium]|nr:hypothetical protein [Gammaproteobacteria bacterium]MDE0415049.1 hypothetical protein [Gammaproteobacteria bacterium]